jgi:large subunit ribosomal protein L25
MDSVSLKVQVRDTEVKAKHLRRDSGVIPAEFYGHGLENVSLQMDYQTFRKLYRVAGENTIIDLAIEGSDTKKVLVHRVDYHPVSDAISYVEFINVRMDEEVTTHVPINLEGQAPAVKELAGVLVQSLDEIEIRCLPANLIHEVTVSVESLIDFHTAIHVSDIKLPADITLITDLETTVANVSPPREEEVEEVPEMDVASVGVDGEAKEEGGEDGEEKKDGDKS